MNGQVRGSTLFATSTTANSFVTRMANEPEFQLYATNGVSGGGSGTVKAAIGLYFDNTLANLNGGIQFTRGGAGIDGWMNFLTSGTERMRIDSSGNVGIGTSSPAQRLDVLSSGDTPVIFRSSGGNVYLQFINSTASAGYIGYSGSALTFWTGSERVRITAAGDVGVGTSAPVNKLQSAYNVPVSVPATGTVGGHGFAVGGGGFGIAAGALNNGNGYLQVTHWDGTSANYNLLLQPNGGNVGIKTATPGLALSVNGEASVGVGNKLSLIGLDINSQGTPNFIKIRTTIPFALSSADFTVNIKGFRYDDAEILDLSVSWHYYLSTFWNPTVKSSGSYAPTVRLSAEGGFVCIVLTGPGYWPKLYVESMYSSAYNDDYSSGWSWVDEDASGSTIVTLAYKSNFGNGFTMNSSGTVSSSVDFRAPIFYDSNNTSFYVDPASTSYLNTVSLGATTWRADITWNGSVNVNISGESSFDMYTGGTFHVWDINASNYAIRANSGGQTVIGTAGTRGLSVQGALTATDNITAYSDIRIKRDIHTVENALEKTLALRGVTYYRTDDRVKEEEKARRKLGVVAQEVELIIPEVVREDDDGFKTVDYGNMVGLLIEAIKEQQAHINRLEQKINSLETK